MAPKILVVEDNKSMREALTCFFREDCHFEVLSLDNGEEAKEQIGQFRPDVVLTDVQLVGQMSGIDLARYAREAFPGILVIIMSGKAKFRSTSRQMELDFLAKPFELKALLNIIKKRGYSH